MAATKSFNEADEEAVYHLLPDHSEHDQERQKNGKSEHAVSYRALMMGISCGVLLQISFAFFWVSNLLLVKLFLTWDQTKEDSTAAIPTITKALFVAIVTGALVMAVLRLTLRGPNIMGATRKSWVVGFVVGRLTSSLFMGWQWADFSPAFWVLFSLEALVLLLHFAGPESTTKASLQLAESEKGSRDPDQAGYHQLPGNNKHDQDHHKNEIQQQPCYSVMMGVVRGLLFQLFSVLLIGSILLLTSMLGTPEVADSIASQTPQQAIYILGRLAWDLVAGWLTSDFCIAFWICYFLVLLSVGKKEAGEPEDSGRSVVTSLV